MKDLNYYLNKAMHEKFSIGAFNFFNMESLYGIAQACKEANSPAFIAISESSLQYMGDFAVIMALQAKKIHPALFLHLDHGKDFEICKIPERRVVTPLRYKKVFEKINQGTLFCNSGNHNMKLLVS